MFGFAAEHLFLSFICASWKHFAEYNMHLVIKNGRFKSRGISSVSLIEGFERVLYKSDLIVFCIVSPS